MRTPKQGGGNQHDILNDAFFSELLERATSGEFAALVAGPPCSTFSVSRFINNNGNGNTNNEDNGPPPVRDRQHIEGLPNVDPKHKKELRIANQLVERCFIIANSVYDTGGVDFD